MGNPKRPKRSRAQLRAERRVDILTPGVGPGFVVKPIYQLWELAIIADGSEEKVLDNLLYKAKVVTQNDVRRVVRGLFGLVNLYPSRRPRKIRPHYVNYSIPLETVLAYVDKRGYFPAESAVPSVPKEADSRLVSAVNTPSQEMAS